jgi:hypothetical protein
MRITKSQLKEIIKEALDDRINPDLDDLEQAGFRPDPEEVARLLAKRFPDLADGRVTQKIGKNDLMVFIAEEYDVSEQTAMQVVEELIQEGIVGMYTDFVNIINADFEEDYDDYEDDAYAMASAGFGTDEDYGFYGENIKRKNKMKITKTQLKQIIKEELSNLTEGNFQEKYCEDNPDAEGCLEYWQEEASELGIDTTDMTGGEILQAIHQHYSMR